MNPRRTLYLTLCLQLSASLLHARAGQQTHPARTEEPAASSFVLAVTDSESSEGEIRDAIRRRHPAMPEESELRLTSTSDSLSGRHLRFTHFVRGIPVHGSVVTADLDRRQVVATVHDRISTLGLGEGIEQERPLRDLLGRRILSSQHELAAVNGELRLAQSIVAEGPDRVPFFYLIEASSGQVLESYSLSFDITARVFDSNPVEKLNNPALQDNANAASAVPEGAYSRVELEGLGTSGFLIGPNVRVIDSDSPATVRADISQPLEFDRSDPRFEEVMAYFQLDRSQRYIQSLGYTGVRRIIPSGVNVDPHAESGADNSHYIPTSVPQLGGSLYYGDGGVDDAEDPDIMLHEYGHAIHDSIAPGALNGSPASQSRALAEAFGDYWAFSSGYAASTVSGRDPFCIADWDARCAGASTGCGYPAGSDCLRRVDGAKTMTDYLKGEVSGTEHLNGEIYSSALRQIFMALVGRYGSSEGKRISDTIALEGLFGLPPGPTFSVAARKLIDADGILNGGKNAAVICEAMTLRLILSASDCDASPKGELTVFQDSDRDVTIPDGDFRGTTLRTRVDDDRLIRRLNVRVEIRHPFRGDLRLTLIAPNGTRILLQQPLPDGGSDIRTTYGLDDQLFSALTGSSARGEWQLEVLDLLRGDQGRVVEWSLLFQFAGDERLTTRSAASVASRFIPVVARVRGAQGTDFVSDVRLFNRGSSTARLTAWFTPGGQDGTVSFSAFQIVIPPSHIVRLDDIVGTWFRTTGIGAVEFRGDVSSVQITARTYSMAGELTFGQFQPFETSGSGTARLRGPLHLISLANSEEFRTNIGVSETAGKPGTVRVILYDRASVEIDRIELAIAPFSQIQFAALGGREGRRVEAFRAEVLVTGGDAAIVAYASVLDNRSGDPVYVRGARLPQSAGTQHIPAVAHINGAAGTRWRSDLSLFNHSSQPRTLQLRYFPSDSDQPPREQSVSLAAGELRQVEDLLAALFGVTEATGQLTAEGEGLDQILISSRTWTPGPGGSYGQLVTARDAAGGVASGERAGQIGQIESFVQYRTNIGAAETSGNSATVRFTLFNAGGDAIWHADRFLPASRHLQFNLAQSGAPSISNGRISVEVLGGTGRVLAYATVIDQLSGDPLYVPAE